MGDLLKAFSNIAQSGSVSDLILVLLVFVGLLGVCAFYITKLIIFIKKDLKDSDQKDKNVTKEDLNNIVDELRDIRSKLEVVCSTGEIVVRLETRLTDEIERLLNVLEKLREEHSDDMKTLLPLQKDIENISDDAKAQHMEINRQIQQVQRDLAALQGTIIGLNTQRTSIR